MTRDEARALFPALASGFAFMENAGGSQLPSSVIEAVTRHLTDRFVQLGAPYERARRATETVAQAHVLAEELLGAEGAGRAILGPSTSVLCKHLADAYALVLKPGDEVVVSQSGHEANIGPWMRLAARGVSVIPWHPQDHQNPCAPDVLKALLTDRTKLVTFAHTSNLLGDIVDVEALTQIAHDAGARVVVDGVAYAPHRRLEVARWNVDWYAFSAYKVYAPHMAVLYGSHEALDVLPEGPNHYFLQQDPTYRFELGGVSHEAAAGLVGLRPYLERLGGVRNAFDTMTAWERPLQERLLEFLSSRDDLVLFGPRDSRRVPTFGFTLTDPARRTVPYYEILCGRLAEAGLGIRYGHMYSYRLCQFLGLEPEAGVLRVSLVHTNTEEEVERLISTLEAVLDEV